MASGTIDCIFIHAVDDPEGTEVRLDALDNVDARAGEAEDDLVERQLMCDGRARAIEEEGELMDVPVSVSYLPRATREALRSLRKRMCCYRDPAGRLIYGMVEGRAYSDLPGDTVEGGFVFRQYDHDPAV